MNRPHGPGSAVHSPDVIGNLHGSGSVTTRNADSVAKCALHSHAASSSLCSLVGSIHAARLQFCSGGWDNIGIIAECALPHCYMSLSYLGPSGDFDAALRASIALAARNGLLLRGDSAQLSRQR